MNVYALPTQLHAVPAADRIIAVGVFDGVHIGHSAVLTKALMVHNLTPAVFTFKQSGNLKSGGCLQTDEGRRKILERLGFADIFEANFAAIQNMTPQEFVDMLHRDLHAKAIVCGFNFRFGKGGAGDTKLLEQLCAQVGIEVMMQPAVTVDGETVSSTRIKQALKTGDTTLVLRLQGRPFTVEATVKSGQKLGRTLGSPTINQPIDENITLPRLGVYAAVATVDGCMHPAVTNIGIRPTVGGTKPLAETYILDFEGDLYGESIPVELVKFLRPEQKFETITALQHAIHKDIADTRALFAPTNTTRAVIFDFDNTLADRQIAFHAFLQDWLRKHFPQMPQTELLAYCDRLLNIGRYGFAPFSDVFDAAKEMLPWQTAPSEEEMFAFLKIAYPLHTTVFDDAAQTIAKLRRRGYIVGILTNGNVRIQTAKLNISGLRPLVDYMLIGGEEDIQKPEAELFCRFAKRLGTHPTDCVFVGDNPINDIEGALNAGMRAVFRDFKYPDVTVDNPAVPHISTLSELLALL